jgi:polyhydroxybutyrate depolymerase
MSRLTTQAVILCTLACGGSNDDKSADTGATGTNTTATTATTTTTTTTTSTQTVVDEGCEVPGPALDQETFSFMVGDMERSYRINAPALAKGASVPLIIAFHGADGRNERFPQQNQFNELATNNEAILVYAMSELVAPNEGEWQLNTTDEMHHDIDYVEALIDQVASSYCIDRDRIYATGYSLGSMFTYELPCHLPETFAAIASHAGTMPVSMYSCDTSSSMGILHIHGQRDILIDYREAWDWKEWDFVGTMMGVPALIGFWDNTYACTDDATSETGDAEYIVHSGCSGDVRVEHIGVKRLGHEWPQTIDGSQTSALIWDFLSDFSRANRDD